MGPDPSQKTEGQIFGIIFTDEKSLQMGLVPHPRSMSPQVQVHLLGQALDVTMSPYSVALSDSNRIDNSSLS